MFKYTETDSSSDDSNLKQITFELQQLRTQMNVLEPCKHVSKATLDEMSRKCNDLERRLFKGNNN